MNARFYLENILFVHSLSCCSLTFNVYGIPRQMAQSKFYQAIKAVFDNHYSPSLTLGADRKEEKTAGTGQCFLLLSL